MASADGPCILILFHRFVTEYGYARTPRSRRTAETAGGGGGDASVGGGCGCICAPCCGRLVSSLPLLPSNRCCSSSHVSVSLLLYWWVAWQCSRRLLTVPLALSCCASVALRQLLLHSHAQAAAFSPLTPRHLSHLLHHRRHVSIPHALTLLLPAPPRQALVCFAPILCPTSPTPTLHPPAPATFLVERSPSAPLPPFFFSFLPPPSLPLLLSPPLCSLSHFSRKAAPAQGAVCAGDVLGTRKYINFTRHQCRSRQALHTRAVIQRIARAHVHELRCLPRRSPACTRKRQAAEGEGRGRVRGGGV
jgi:hypothetical protein